MSDSTFATIEGAPPQPAGSRDLREAEARSDSHSDKVIQDSVALLHRLAGLVDAIGNLSGPRPVTYSGIRRS